MKRPIGVTIIAALLIIISFESIFRFLRITPILIPSGIADAFTLVPYLLTLNIPTIYYQIVMASLLAVGILLGVGLLQLRNIARLCILIFSITRIIEVVNILMNVSVANLTAREVFVNIGVLLVQAAYAVVLTRPNVKGQFS